jgi:hypothetical protein
MCHITSFDVVYIPYYPSFTTSSYEGCGENGQKILQTNLRG